MRHVCFIVFGTLMTKPFASHVRGCCRWALRFSGQMFCHRSAQTQAQYSAPASILSGMTTADQSCTSRPCTKRVIANMQHLAQTRCIGSNKKQKMHCQTSWQLAHCTDHCVPCSVWVGDGNLATVADACITIRLLSCPVQSASSEHSLSLKVLSRRRKTTWRQWLTCQDMQVEEPLLITADATAPSMLQVSCQAALYMVSLISAQVGCNVPW